MRRVGAGRFPLVRVEIVIVLLVAEVGEGSQLCRLEHPLCAGLRQPS